jgi:hypothetical protein
MGVQNFSEIYLFQVRLPTRSLCAGKVTRSKYCEGAWGMPRWWTFMCGGRVYGMWGLEPIPTGTYSRDSLAPASQCQDAQVSQDNSEIIGLVAFIILE